MSEAAVTLVYPNGMPGPATISLGGQTIPQPRTGLIVKWKLAGDGQFHWLDASGTVFDPFVKVNLPDQDVFAIDAAANPPVAAKSAPFAHVGTTLFNMAVNPKTGKVYVSNTDAHNDVRFEGHTPGFTSVVGNIVDSRITVLDPKTQNIVSANLNPHLDHAAGTGDPSLSRAFPQDLAVSCDGRKLYVVAQGSSKLAIYDTALLETGSAPASAANQVVLSGGGPTGVVLDQDGDQAFVLTRFDNSISVVDLRRRREIEHQAMFNPEPRIVTAGRKSLYDATFTSSLGDQACGGCHIGGDNDGLAWDLGNPGGIPLAITKTFAKESDVNAIPEAALVALFGNTIKFLFAAYQPAKGPMTTQSLRGLDNHGSMHWRGDRNGAVQQSGLPFLDGSGAPIVSAQPNQGIFDEFNAFKSFNVAFPGLIGRAAQLTDADMTDFTNFTLEISYPPNPLRKLDDTLTPLEAAGQAFYFNQAPDGTQLPSDRFHNCNGCHVLDRNGNAGATKHPGFFGTDGRLSFENETQIFKVPHLRNAYQKLGMYGSSPDQRHAVASVIPPLNPNSTTARRRPSSTFSRGSCSSRPRRRSSSTERRLRRTPSASRCLPIRPIRSIRRRASRPMASRFGVRSRRSSFRSTRTCVPSSASKSRSIRRMRRRSPSASLSSKRKPPRARATSSCAAIFDTATRVSFFRTARSSRTSPRRPRSATSRFARWSATSPAH